VVSLFRGRERPDGFDVVNVGSPPLAHVLLAPATGTLVALSYIPADRSPGGTVGVGVPTTPGGIVLPSAVEIAAREGAEGQPALSFPPVVGVVKRLLAVGADEGMKDTLPLWPRGGRDKPRLGLRGVAIGRLDHPLDQSQAPPLVVARPGTEDVTVLRLLLGRTPGEWGGADAAHKPCFRAGGARSTARQPLALVYKVGVRHVGGPARIATSFHTRFIPQL
jgi:hypothetical protein